LGLGAASAAAQYVVTHPQPSHNPVNLDFLLDPLSKSEFLSFPFILQAGFEKLLTVYPIMQKANVFFGMGAMDSANTYSFLQLILDNEFVKAVRKQFTGISFKNLEEEVEMIKEIGRFGDYLTTQHTMDNFKNYFHSEILSRNTYETWLKKSDSLEDRLKKKYKKIIEAKSEPAIDEKKDVEIMRLFKANKIHYDNKYQI